MRADGSDRGTRIGFGTAYLVAAGTVGWGPSYMSVRAMRRKVKEEEQQGGAFEAQCMVWRMADGVWADSVYGCGPVERGLDSPLGWPGAGAGAGAGGEGEK